eukprot:775639-Amphidinium_carterae.1
MDRLAPPTELQGVAAGDVMECIAGLRADSDGNHGEAHKQDTVHDVQWALSLGARFGRDLLVQALLMSLADPSQGVTRHGGLTPLHWAAASGHVKVIETLAPKKACIQATTEQGATVAHVAAAAGSVHALEVLLALGSPVRARDKSRQSLLHYAVRADSMDAAALLVQRRVELN